MNVGEVYVEPEPTVCWMAYFNDMSDIAVFAFELDALRYAVANHMEVIELKAGSATDQINQRYKS